MTIREFSNEFDILLNSFSIPSLIGEPSNRLDITLDEYEKSVFLTQAQEDLVTEIYSGKNVFGDTFEKTEESRRYLSPLVKTYITSESIEHSGVTKDSTFYKLPDDLWFITYESVTLEDGRMGCMNGSEAMVVPVTQDDFFRIQKNPFRGPSKGRVLRLDIKGNIVELVSDYNISQYLVRYISRPKPIIVANLDGLYINGVGVESECELNPVIHRAILERAVRLAIASKVQLSGSKE